MSAPAPPPPRPNYFAIAAVLASGAAVLVCALVGIAYMAGWVGQREHPAVAAVAGAAGKKPADEATSLALAPNETLVESAAVPARPEPLFPKYGAPVAPLPAPPESAATRPTGVPRSPYLPAPGARTPPAPLPAPQPSPVEAPRPREEPRREERYAERYAEEVRPSREEVRERRGARRFCETCAVVTAVSQYVDEWEVHLRFSDGSRRRILYDRPPPVARGDRVYFENGRLYLE